MAEASETPGTVPESIPGEKKLKRAKSNKNLRRGNPGKRGTRSAPAAVKIYPWAEKALTAAVAKNPLEVFVHVLSKPPELDETYEQREYRKWLHDDRKGFMERRHQLEKTGPGVAGATPGTEISEDIAEMLGEEWQRLLRFKQKESESDERKPGETVVVHSDGQGHVADAGQDDRSVRDDGGVPIEGGPGGLVRSASHDTGAVPTADFGDYPAIDGGVGGGGGVFADEVRTDERSIEREDGGTAEAGLEPDR
jgi:hypothetical protein